MCYVVTNAAIEYESGIVVLAHKLRKANLPRFLWMRFY
jgi:hypothetical protein